MKKNPTQGRPRSANVMLPVSAEQADWIREQAEHERVRPETWLRRLLDREQKGRTVMDVEKRLDRLEKAVKNTEAMIQFFAHDGDFNALRNLHPHFAERQIYRGRLPATQPEPR
jgi:hypothetical protein